jgi:hypothetical protein
MFIRSVKIPSSNGSVHEYVRIVSSVRENGNIRQKVVANLGRRDTLESVLPLLNRFLKGEEAPERLAKDLGEAGPIEVIDAGTWGPMLVCRHFFKQLGLWQLLDDGRRWRKLMPSEDPNDDWVSRVLVLIVNRLTRPSSEHALAGWLETDYVCDRLGRRYVPRWKQRGRVEVDLGQLQRWYRTLDHLLLNKDRIEVALFERLRDLFDFEPDLVFYDLTSTYFEGRGPVPLARHSLPPRGLRRRSRDGHREQSRIAPGHGRSRVPGGDEAAAKSGGGSPRRPHRRREVDRLSGRRHCQ